MRDILKLLVAFVLAVIVIVGSFAGGFAASRLFIQPKTAEVQDGAPPELQSAMPIFWEAWNVVQSEFYKQPVDPEKMTYGAIGGMVDALGDIHTIFLDPSFAKKENEQLQGSYEGIGAQVDMREGRLVIVAPFKNSPADRAGLKPGDIILKVGDTAIQNMTSDDAVALIKGPRGTKVKLTIQRGTQPAFTLEIVRDAIEIPAIESKMLEGNIAYIRLNEFSAPSPEQLHSTLQEMLAKKPKALILDVRSNPGGFLDAAIKVANEFLKPNTTVLIEKYKNGDKQEYKTEGGGIGYDIPMVLMVNEGSASASEIVAGALKDYKRATILGTKTYGKGSVQNPHQLSDDSQLRITIAHFFSPQDHEINGVGISPDIESPDPTDAQMALGQDPQLDRAVQYINSGAQLGVGQWLLPLFMPAFADLPL